MANDYRFRGKDPIIDLMRTLVQTRAEIEGLSFNKVLHAIERETNHGVKAGTMYNWFMGSTMWPQYRMVARVILNLRSFARRPIAIGDKQAYPVLRNVARRAHG